MAKYKIPPLRPFTIPVRPLSNGNAIAWSCDGELAVAGDDSLHVFMPHFKSLGKEGDEDGEDDISSLRPQYYSTPLRMAIPKYLDPRMNRYLLAGANASIKDEIGFDPGCGEGDVTGFGAALNQVIRVEWSPTGMGPNLRPILTLALTRGAVVAWGESKKSQSQSALNLDSGSRELSSWKALWAIGGNMPLPDGDGKNGYSTKRDRITSFSWAKTIAPGRGLLAYVTDTAELVIMAVQYLETLDEGAASKNWTGEPLWRIDEVCRVDISGPHVPVDVHDPDYTPSGSSRSVSWSPWLLIGDNYQSKAAMVGYLELHYVGFRKITLDGPWMPGQLPTVRIDKLNTLGICCHLAPDAFVEWEDAIWTTKGAKVCRGVLATPVLAKPFEVVLNTTPALEPIRHSTDKCNSTYPPDAGPDSTNPIAGLIVYPPDLSRKSPTPVYMIVRNSATSLNDNWFQHNLPLRPAFKDKQLSRWADYIDRRINAQLPETMSWGVLDPSDASDDDDFEDLPASAGQQVHTCRVRIWGLIASPGGGSTAVLFSEHSTVRIGKAARIKVAFSSTPRGEVEEPREPSTWSELTAEGKAWEWMYGGGREFDGFPDKKADADPKLYDLFKDVVAHQVCPLCRAGLTKDGRDFVCSNDHAFARCCASGLPILRPNISRLCGLCGGRNIVVEELKRVAQEHHGRDVDLDFSGEVCQGCGGKFVL